MVSHQTVRRWILTASIAAISGTGAIYGAGLRTRQEITSERKRAQEASPQDKIDQLEPVLRELNTKKHELERRRAEVQARMRGEEVRREGNRE